MQADAAQNNRLPGLLTCSFKLEGSSASSNSRSTPLTKLSMDDLEMRSEVVQGMMAELAVSLVKTALSKAQQRLALVTLYLGTTNFSSIIQKNKISDFLAPRTASSSPPALAPPRTSSPPSESTQKRPRDEEEEDVDVRDVTEEGRAADTSTSGSSALASSGPPAPARAAAASSSSANVSLDLDQVDPDVLKELPDHIRREILRAMDQAKGGGRPSGASAPKGQAAARKTSKKRAKGARGGGGGGGRTLDAYLKMPAST